MSLISYEKALEKLLLISTPLTANTTLHVEDSLGFICASDIICTKNLPSFNNSAMDGYAFNFSDKDGTLHVKKSIFAGEVSESLLNKDECYKIMTGAKIPDDADTIVAFEDAILVDETHIKIPQKIKKHNAYRFKGEEQKRGSIIIKKGTLLNPSHLTLLASQGIMSVDVYKKPKIVVLSTGNEIKEPWESIDEESIYNCNSSAIIAILNRYGFEADYGGVVADNLQISIDFFASLKGKYDIIITSGGVSQGEADFVLKALNANGFKEAFHGINLKPGRPTLCGTMDKCLIISLPGNPMATFLNSYLFAIPAIKKRANYQNPKHSTCRAKNKISFSFKPNRTNIILGTYKDGNFSVTNNNKYGSGMITPMINSNCISLSTESQNTYKENEDIEVIML